MPIKKLIAYKTSFLLLALIALFIVSCEPDNNELIPETGTVTDIDGNIYKTVKIGNRWWMAENLRVTRYNNGDSIEYIPRNLSEISWSKLNNGAYCYLDQDFGFLYNFYVVTDVRKVTPQGWHVPSDEEWKDLETFLGMSPQAADSSNWRGTDQGNKLKIEGGSTKYWIESSDTYRIVGTNISGFTAIGSSARIFNGLWGDLTHNAFWWTSTSSGNEAWYRGLDYNKSSILRLQGSKNYGFSIRCIKD